MAQVTISEGRICIVKVSSVSSTREGLEQLKSSIVDLTQNSKKKGELDLFLFIDLSPFTVINSNLIGVFGSIVMDDSIKLLGLCGIQHSVQDILKRFGVLSATSTNKNKDLKKLTKTEKVISFKSLEEGVTFLVP